MRPIPHLFRIDGYLGGKVSNEPFNRYSREILAGSDAWTPRRKHNGLPLLFDENGEWFQSIRVHRDSPAPEGFREIRWGRENNSPEYRSGWKPAEAARLNLLDRALEGGGFVPRRGETYELCGPGICGNTERLPRPRLYQHSKAEICLDLLDRELSYSFLRAYFRTTLVKDRWEGIVWHGPLAKHGAGPLMMKLRVNDFVSL